MKNLAYYYSGKYYYIAKALTICVFFWFVVKIARAIYLDILDDGDFNYVNVLFLIAETVTFIVVIIARFPKDVNVSFKTVIYAAIGTYYLVFVNFAGSGTVILVNQGFCFGLMLFGIVLQVYAKVVLGRSFGILPANRNVVSSGPYSYVRHPIYFSYLMEHIGFLLGAFSLWNLGVFVVLYIFQIFRIIEEEKVLSRDEAYVEYKKRVPYRLVPFIF